MTRRPLTTSRGPVRRGFSLFELALVLAIVATLAAVAVPRYAASTARYRADLTARRIVADLDFARDRARTSSKTVTVKFDLPSNRLWLPGVSGLEDASSEYIVNFGDAPYRAQLVFADLGGSPAVNFDGYGRPGSGGVVVVRVGEALRTIVLDADSGRAAVQ